MIVSIDIGTSYSSMSMIGPDGKPVPVAIGEDGTAWGSKTLLPSAVFVEENGNILVGQAAMRSRLRKPECFRMEFKRNLGEDTPLLLGGRSFRVEELYTELLLHMKACVKKTTGEDIELAYITCPATYRKDKKERLISAAKAAGLFQVELVPEPTAAAMSYVAAGYVKDGQTLLVYDFGGGTFDAALIEYKDGSFLPLGEPLGLPRCGGIDMDRLIYQDMMKVVDPDTITMLQKKQEHYLRFAGQLSEKAVQIKHQLSSAQAATEYIPMGWDQLEYTLTRQAFEEMIAPMIDQTTHVCEDALTSAGLEKSDLSAVVLVGGTSRVPLVQQMVKQFAGKVPVYVAPDVDLAVVQGALSYRQYNAGAMAEKWYQDAKKLKEQGGSPKEVAALYRKAAEQGHMRAQYMLGVRYFYGFGVEKDYAEAVKWYRKSAEQGDAVAQYLLGACYECGAGDGQDDTEAVKWYRKSAEQGCAKAQYKLGVCYDDGNGVGQDYAEAAKWYRKAAEQGYVFAQYNLGVCYALGTGVEQDHVEAVKWYRKAAEQGDAYAQYNLGVRYGHGTGVGKDHVEAAKWYHKAAEQGFASAQNNLGVCYEYGTGVGKDHVEAAKWYHKAAEQGFASAQTNLGICFAQEIGVEQDHAEAAKWYRKAAEQGYAVAQYNLGYCYDSGTGVGQDPVEAVKWYHKAAEQGHAEAQFHLGLCYANGTGVEQDPAEAVKWYRKAAEQGDADAQYRLGVSYYNGIGVGQNYVEMAKWYRKAAEQGFADAQYNLGVCYAKGIGVRENPAEALKWCSKAAEQGHQEAKMRLPLLKVLCSINKGPAGIIHD